MINICDNFVKNYNSKPLFTKIRIPCKKVKTNYFYFFGAFLLALKTSASKKR